MEKSMTAFAQYLIAYKVDPVHLFIKAQVRYATVWNATKGYPITSENAEKIKQALLDLTGIPYTGPFVLMEEQPVDQVPTITMKSCTNKSIKRNRTV